MSLLRTVLLLGLAVGAMSAQMKQKLAQQADRSLAQEISCEPTIQAVLPPLVSLECPCNFTALPGLGAGINLGFSQDAAVVQEQHLDSVPDTQFTQICQSNCCECNEEAHTSF